MTLVRLGKDYKNNDDLIRLLGSPFGDCIKCLQDRGYKLPIKKAYYSNAECIINYYFVLGEDGNASKYKFEIFATITYFSISKVCKVYRSQLFFVYDIFGADGYELCPEKRILVESFDINPLSLVI